MSLGTKLLFLQPNGVFSKSEYLWSGWRIASGFVTDRDLDTNQFGVRSGHSTQMMPPLLSRLTSFYLLSVFAESILGFWSGQQTFLQEIHWLRA